MQVFIACGVASSGGKDDLYRKPKPGMWQLMKKHFNSGIEIDMDKFVFSQLALKILNLAVKFLARLERLHTFVHQLSFLFKLHLFVCVLSSTSVWL